MKKVIKHFAIGFVLIFASIVFVLSNQIGGFRIFTVMSGSMIPTIQTGSVIVTQQIDPIHLRSNDIITFIPPTKERMFVTHRIVSVTQKHRLTILKTKGDNNPNADRWTLSGGGVVGKNIAIVPYLGFLFAAIHSKLGVLFFILLPAAYIIIDEIFFIIRLLKNHRERYFVSRTFLKEGTSSSKKATTTNLLESKKPVQV